MNVLLIRLTLAFAITLPFADATRERTLRGIRGLNAKEGRFALVEGHCEICSKENKAFPESLTFQFSHLGADSLYQPSGFVSCKATTVVDATSLKIMTTTGDFQQFGTLEEGTIFTVKGPFRKDSFFLWGGAGVCSIDTSCKAPLVAGDQFGPFKLLAGNNCTGFIPDSDDWNGGGVTSAGSDASAFPSSVPSAVPSGLPSLLPSGEPSGLPSSIPSDIPSDLGASSSNTVDVLGSDLPSSEPSSAPSGLPSLIPSAEPSTVPSDTPSATLSELPSGVPSSIPSGLPSSIPSGVPSSIPSGVPSSIPSGVPSSIPSGAPSSIPSGVPSSIPTGVPSSIPSDIPSKGAASSGAEIDVSSASPSDAPCLSVLKTSFVCGEPIDVFFDFDKGPGRPPLTDDWVGIYSCDTKVYDEFETNIWQWTCGVLPSECPGPKGKGALTFDQLPSYNDYNNKQKWPVQPFFNNDGSVSRCFKAVLLRNTGMEGLVYDLSSYPICESAHFNIYESPICPIETSP